MKAKSALITTLALLALNAPSNASAASPLLEFSNGNQIYGSTLAISSTGKITHTERNCCPPHTDPVREKQLTAADLSHLKRLITAAAKARVLDHEGAPTSEGSTAGELAANVGKKKIVIYRIERASPDGGHNKVSVNQAPEAALIKKLVEGYVKVPFDANN